MRGRGRAVTGRERTLRGRPGDATRVGRDAVADVAMDGSADAARADVPTPDRSGADIGREAAAPDVRVPDAVAASSAATLAAGTPHNCALRADGTARCWGSSADGQLGAGPTSYGWTATPVPVMGLP